MEIDETAGLPAVSEPGSYQVTRFNATRHAVLSKYNVLPWEDEQAYRQLLEALVSDHRPEGETEHYLVEQLASIMWRKRRLRLAELAIHHQRHAFLLSAGAPYPVPTEGQPGAFEGRDLALKYASKLMAMYVRQLETLDKHRGKGQQKITVEHVTVNAVGQGIVSNVTAGTAWTAVGGNSSGAATEGAAASAEVPALTHDLTVLAPEFEIAARKTRDKRRG